MKKKNQLLKKITLMLFSGLLCLIALELFLRQTHFLGARLSWSTSDTLLAYRYLPSRDYWFHKENDHPIEGKINSHGWRDQERSLRAAPGIHRVAVLGDSYVEGFQVELEKTCLALAETSLNTAGIPIELLNFARSGFTQTEQYLLLQQEIPRFAPQTLVLFFFPGNDITDISAQTAPNTIRPFYLEANDKLELDLSFTSSPVFRQMQRVNWWKANSIVVSLACVQYNIYKEKKQIAGQKLRWEQAQASTPGKSSLGPVLSLCTKNPDPTYLKNYQLNKRLIREIAHFCRQQNWNFLLTSISTGAYVLQTEQEYLATDPSFQADFFDEDLAQLAKENGFHHLGLYWAFRKDYLKNQSLLHWSHWNYQGHEVVSQALSEKLQEMLAKGQ